MGYIITANLAKGRKVITEPVFRWNHGMVLKFIGVTLPDNYRVDFSNALNGTAKSQMGTAENGVIIPDEYFMPGQTIFAWVVLSPTENSAITEFQVSIPIDPKAKATDEEPSAQQESIIDQAISAMNTTISNANEAVSHYPKIVDEYWYVWDVADSEYVTTGVKSTGEDGVSPVVTVESITGGHRVTITDANGDHVFDVLDGVNGDPGRGIATIAKTGTSGLTDTYTITYTDGNVQTYTVVNGADGSPGASAYVWIRYAATEPTQDSDMKTTPDAWMGIYSGDSATAPTAYTAYTWYNIKGQTGPVQDVQVNGTSVVTDGVAEIPAGGNGIMGVYKLGANTNGLEIVSEQLRIIGANDTQIRDPASNVLRPIIPSQQHKATFYGLAKAAGDTTQSQSSNAVGNYTDAAKSAISTMLTAPVTVSGSTPVIAALPGIQYVCGEVATLDITLPASGCIDVVFESGSTPTVLTITPQSGMTVEWANGFDSTSLEADTLYELNIKMVGTKCLGVAGQWS